MSDEKLLLRLDHPHGPGDTFISWQHGSGGFFATTGVDQSVVIYDHHGRKVEHIPLQGACTGFGWDVDGDLLAIITSSSPHIILWDANTGKKSQVDTGLRDSMSCVRWSKIGSVLAVGTARGNLTIYNHSTAKRIPVLGKHTKRISCGAWSTENLLALGSEDKTLSISNTEGDTLRIISLRSEPSDIQFSEMKLDERLDGEHTVSVLVGRKTLFLYNLHDPENPVELAFQQRYGSVVTYKWFGDGYILLGFSAGFFVAISTHMKEVGQELFQAKNHRNSLNDIAVCSRLGKVASCGDNQVKIHDMSNLQETSSVLTVEEDEVERLSWSEDGQLLGVVTHSGTIYIYLSQLPIIWSVFNTHAAVLTSLTELTLYSCESKAPTPRLTVHLPMEPSFMSLGPYHCAAGMNNRAWFYELGQNKATLLRDREYLGTVSSLRLSADYASVLYEGKIQLHMIETPDVSSEDRESKMFPSQHPLDMNITAHALTTDFLIYASSMGHIHYFFLEDWKLVTDFQHTAGIRELYADQTGIRLIVVDDRSEGYVYSPIADEMLKIPDFPASCSGALWDCDAQEHNVFIVFDDTKIITYLYDKDSIEGTSVINAGLCKLPTNQVPLLLFGGQVVLETASGKLTQMTLPTHEISGPSIHDIQKGSLQQTLDRQLKLHRFSEAWKTCQVLNRKEAWEQLTEGLLRSLEIEFAIRVYRHIGNVGMVWSLQSIQNIEDQRLLAGHVSMFLQDFDRAQDWYLKSSQPVAALHMRQDLLHWDQALQLAAKLAPEQVPYIAREYAQQLEFIGNYAEALSHYERGLLEAHTTEGKKPHPDEETHNMQCRAGVARTAIRCGDIRRGVSIAADTSSSRQLKRECADILESMKQHLNDAAMLYESGLFYDKAASAYIRLKNWEKVGDVLPNVTSPKIHLQYAKAKEADGKYQEALKAYEMARDMDSVVRLNLDHLNNPEEAVHVVQETKSIEGAKMVARFFQRLGDYRSAIRFLVLSRCHDEAFQLARQHHQMELYGEVLTDSLEADVKPQDFNSLALHFEGENNSMLAGKYYYHAGDYSKALKHLMQVLKANSEDPKVISLAIEVVAVASDDHLASQLIEFLLGEADGIPKDPKFLFRLYMARHQYREAAKTAIIVASQEQINGNYRNAHDVLFEMYQELRRNGIKIPTEMHSNLMLLHSYILVRLHVRQGEHLKGARMLIRVANNISKFPSRGPKVLQEDRSCGAQTRLKAVGGK
ncbi:WD repeat-containing protein 19 isoform X3 [Cryptotermes secundus]|uniref:WD repeat-containing protein 19 isoform X3 n=1 Tax=Cryptotermes secundus TaxID=105785 RepID=UPI001454C259|nr:WD repeat-containing protein 19 isoform X3 [Cryptotermes secundus]